MDRRVTPPTTWGPPPPCKQALKQLLRWWPMVLRTNSSVLTKTRCFPNNIIHWISNYPVDSVNWAREVGDKLKKTLLTMSMNTAPRDKNARRFML